MSHSSIRMRVALRVDTHVATGFVQHPNHAASDGRVRAVIGVDAVAIGEHVHILDV